MATVKETLLSPWPPTDREETLICFRKQAGKSLKKSNDRRRELPGDLSTSKRDQCLSEAVRLQRRWQELSERERRARQHNRQLLQDFDRAQDTLRDMVARTAAMNTIRMEYKMYLEESFPRWQQQLKEKTLSAQRKRTEEHLKECLERMDNEKVTRSHTEAELSPSQGLAKQPQKAAAPEEHYNRNGHQDYNKNVSPHPSIPSIHSSWLTDTCSHASRFPTRMPFQPQSSSHVPLHLPHHTSRQPQPFQPHHLSFTPSHPHLAPHQGPWLWTAHQADGPVASAAGVAGFPSGPPIPWTLLSVPEPSGWGGAVQGQGAGQREAERSAVPTPEGESGGEDRQRGDSRSCGLSQELDIKPVRLPSGRKQSSGSDKDSSQSGRERRKRREEKRGRHGKSSADRGEGSSQGSSRTSSAIVITSASVADSSESDRSSETGSVRGGPPVKLPTRRQHKKQEERTRSEGDDSGSRKEDTPTVPMVESWSRRMEDSTTRAAGNLNPINESQSRRVVEPGSGTEESASCEESGSVSVIIEDGEADETEGEEEEEEEEESTGAEPGEDDEGEKGGERDGEKEQVDDDSDVNDNEENGQRDGEEDDNEKSVREKTTEGKRKRIEEKEEEEDDDDDDEDSEGQGGVGEKSDREMHEESENENEDSGTTRHGETEEEEAGGGGEEEEEEEQRSEEAGEPEEERDSEDSIISPQKHRSTRNISRIFEEEEEEEEALGDDDSNEGDDGKGDSQKSHSSDSCNDFNDDDDDEDDDIERLLAPQAETQTEREKELKATDKPTKAISEDLDTLSGELDRKLKAAKDTNSDDEFDHFYD